MATIRTGHLMPRRCRGGPLVFVDGYYCMDLQLRRGCATQTVSLGPRTLTPLRPRRPVHTIRRENGYETTTKTVLSLVRSVHRRDCPYVVVVSEDSCQGGARCHRYPLCRNSATVRVGASCHPGAGCMGLLALGFCLAGCWENRGQCKGASQKRGTRMEHPM